MFEPFDSVLRNRWLWLVFLAAAYVLPALLVDIPMALMFPWVMIPNAHEGVVRVFGLKYAYGTPRLLVGIGFHTIFWPLCALLVFWPKRLSPAILRICSAFLMGILILTVYGCQDAIDAVRH